VTGSSSVPIVSPTALILGARNLGGAIASHLAERGWQVAAVAFTEETTASFEQAVPGALGIALDASTPAGVDEAVRRTRERFGTPTLLVNAVAAGPSPSGAPFGGGPLADLSQEDFEHYALRVARQTYAFLSSGVRALRESGSGGTLIQITGGSTRRAIPGRGAWAAGAFATRALTQSASLELRDEGIHAALLIVDATIKSPKTAAYTQNAGEFDLAEQVDVARAVEYLAAQEPTAWTHELQVTPRGDRWLP
jgi:NAD(P)-dependent dehydrogenase (short-subunit alcohol dehydrogenase family)